MVPNCETFVQTSAVKVRQQVSRHSLLSWYAQQTSSTSDYVLHGAPEVYTLGEMVYQNRLAITQNKIKSYKDTLVQYAQDKSI